MKQKNILAIMLILGLSYWAIAPLFAQEFFPMHDDTQVARVFEMNKALTDGMFPVRWSPDLGYGYGYPLFNFYAPLAYYTGGLINFFTDSLTATKGMIILGILFSGIFMYLFAKTFWGKLGGIVSAMLYLYAPYHAVNIYVRGDVAEFWAYAFIPLVFFGVYIVLKSSFVGTSRDLSLRIFLAGTAYACIILSHNLTAMMITPFLFCFICILFFISKKKKYFLLHTSYFIILSLLFSAFYWLPVFGEMQYTNVLSQVGGTANYSDHFVCINQLWDSSWGFGGTTPTCIDGFSFRIGKIHILLTLFVFALLPFFWKKIQTKTILFFFLFICLFSVFLTLASSQFIWDSLSSMAFFQYPWRFLAIICFSISFLGGASIIIIKESITVIGGKKLQNFYFCHSRGCGNPALSINKNDEILTFIATIILIGIIIATYAKLFVPQIILHKTATDYTSKTALNWDASKLTAEYLPKGFSRPAIEKDVPQNKFVMPANVGSVIFLQNKTQHITANFTMNKASDVLIHQAYFPAWHVFLDQKEISYQETAKGMIIFMPKGDHILELKFIQTPIEQIGNALSITGVFLMILGIIILRKKITHAKKIT